MDVPLGANPSRSISGSAFLPARAAAYEAEAEDTNSFAGATCPGFDASALPGVDHT